FGAMTLRTIAGKKGRISKLPLAGGWTSVRDLPVPQGATFMDQWKKQQRGRK
ncbi:MAG: (Fe-S)-binding protein, partial [Sneathiella sp.]